MKKLYSLFCLVTSTLSGFSPVVNRYLPFVSSPYLSETTQTPHALHVQMMAVQASKLFNSGEDDVSLYQNNGILEIDGAYKLSAIVNAQKEKAAREGVAYVSAFDRETGGGAWAGRELAFGARSSLLMFGGTLAHERSFGKYIRCGIELPFMRVEAREQYVFPISERDRGLSIPDREQVQRLRRYVHEDLGLTVGDWTHEGIGDLSVWGQYKQAWKHVWLLRSASLAGSIAVSAPLGSKRDELYAASIPLGGNGHWGIALCFTPEAELKEGWRLALPLSLTGQTSHTRVRRLSIYNEPALFSPLEAKTKIAPGLTLTFNPCLTVEHLSDNLHCSLGWNFTKHWADTVTDMRSDTTTVPSYLTRTTLYKPIVGSTLAMQRQNIAHNQADKKRLSKWHSHYLTFDVAYELYDVFPQLDTVPTIRFTLDYALSGAQRARSYKIGATFSWRF